MTINLSKFAGLAVAVLLASCSSVPAPSTQIVQVPVPRPCVKAAPVRRRMSSTSYRLRPAIATRFLLSCAIGHTTANTLLTWRRYFKWLFLVVLG